MFTLAIANQKGGVAKTTSSANIADAAAQRGARVLLVDLDPQSNATNLTDVEPLEHAGNAFGKVQHVGIGDALYFAQERVGAEPQPGTALRIVVDSGEHWAAGLRVAPATEDLAARGQETFTGAEQRLAISLDGAAEHFDLVVIDCGPMLGPLFLAALHAADGVLLVTEPADNAMEGLPRTISVLRSVQAQRDGVTPRLLGVVATNVASREARPAELLALLREQYGELLWDVVPRRTIVRQAEGAHAPVRAFGAEGREVAEVYDRIAARVLDRATNPIPTGA